MFLSRFAIVLFSFFHLNDRRVLSAIKISAPMVLWPALETT